MDDNEYDKPKDPSKREFLRNVGKAAIAGTIIGTGLAHQGMIFHPDRRTKEGTMQGEFLLDAINQIDQSTNAHWTYYENKIAGLISPLTEIQMPTGIARIDIQCKTNDGQNIAITKNNESISASSSSYYTSNGSATEQTVPAKIEDFSAAIVNANYIVIRYLSEPFEISESSDLHAYVGQANLNPDTSAISRFRVVELLKAEDQDALALRRRQTYFNLLNDANPPKAEGYIVETRNDIPDGFTNHETQNGSRVVINGEQLKVPDGLLEALEESFTASR